MILDISCQHLGDECKLEGFCVPGHRVDLPITSDISTLLARIPQLTQKGSIADGSQTMNDYFIFAFQNLMFD